MNDIIAGLSLSSPSEEHERAHTVFWTTLDDAHRKLAQKICDDHGGGDFDESFLGFLGTYYLLAQLIPVDRIVYDAGCAHAFQAWFFRNHRGYVGIADSPPNHHRFYTSNTTHFHGSMAAWSATPLHKVDDVHFAIHNYCPGGHADVLKTFHDLYTFYPRSTGSGIPGFRGYVAPWEKPS